MYTQKPSDISQIFSTYGIKRSIDLSLLPKTDNYLKINDTLQIPLYGSLIGVERELVERFKALRAHLFNLVDKYLLKLDKEYVSIFDQNIRRSIALDSLVSGEYTYCPEGYIDFPDALSDTLVLVDDLAEAYEMKDGFTTLFPIIEGVPDERLYKLASVMDDFMLSIGVGGLTLLERLNNLLYRKPLLDLSKSLTVDVSHIESGLTPEEIANIQYLTSPFCVPSIILACRTNNFVTDYLSYLPIEEDIGGGLVSLGSVIEALDQEAETPVSTPTKVNKNTKQKKSDEQPVEESEEKK